MTDFEDFTEREEASKILGVFYNVENAIDKILDDLRHFIEGDAKKSLQYRKQLENFRTTSAECFLYNIEERTVE